jgi:UTP--glucose-1-phosphate uridylyltransferase
MASEERVGFGLLLQQARERAGLTREQLARRVGLDVSHLFRIETGGRRPSRDSALALAVALELDDEAVNHWLVAAGYAPVAALGAIRDGVRARGAVRARRGAHAQDGSQAEPSLWDAGAGAKRLEAIGLTEGAIARLLGAMSSASLAEQEQAAAALSTAFVRIAESVASPVRTAVIPAAGGQHRLLAAHVMQRLLLGAIGEAARSGIRDIVLILAPGSVESLYEPLKEALELAVVPTVRLMCCEQPAPEGLGDAILRAESKASPGPFAVLLPDDVVRERAGRSLARDFRRMIAALATLDGASLVAVCPVPKTQLAHCGAARTGGKAIHDNVFPIIELAEKPRSGSPILAARNVQGIVGRYLLQPEIFAALRDLKKRGGRPVELTGALDALLHAGARVCAYQIDATRRDIGAVLDEARGLMENRSSSGPER